MVLIIIIFSAIVFFLIVVIRANVSEIASKDARIKELQDIARTLLEKNKVYKEANAKAEDIIKKAEEKANSIIEKAKDKGNCIKSDAKIVASETLRDATFMLDRHKIDKMIAEAAPGKKDCLDIPEKTKKEYTKEYFKGRYDDKKIPAEYLKPKIDIEFINNPLARRKIVITGDLEQIFRIDLAEELWNLGADIDSSVGKNTNLLIIGSEPGPKKMDQLKEYTQIETVNEEELIALLMAADGWESEANKLIRMTFFIAGELNFFTGPNIKLLILDNGGKIATRISSKVNYVLLGDNPDYTIINEAEKAKINFLSEEGLLNIFGIKTSVREYL